MFVLAFCIADQSSGQPSGRIYSASFDPEKNAITETVLLDSLTGEKYAYVVHPAKPVLYLFRKEEAGTVIETLDTESHKRSILYESREPLAMPRVAPDGSSITFFTASGVMVRLGLPALKMSSITPLLPASSIENYLWMDENTLLATVAGRPNSLNLLTLRPSRVLPVSQHVGSTLTTAGAGSFAFVQKISVDTWVIKQILPDGSIKIITETIPESELFTISASGKILMISENQLFLLRGKSWQKTAMNSPGKNLKEISFNGDGTRLFILVSDQ